MELIIRSILLEEQEKGLLLAKDCCTDLLREDTGLESADFPVGTELIRYPKYPLHIEVCKKLAQWIETGLPPYSALETYELLNESIYEDLQLKTTQRVGCILAGFKESSYAEEIKHKLSEVLSFLGQRGILDLLGLRRTLGSVDMFPPPLSVIWKAFNRKHSPKSILTAGARALSKHCHRDNSVKWWGVSSGTEQAKNEHAQSVLMKLLCDVTWVNIHTLPHGVHVLEIRGSEGYGARWSQDGTVFRGFLEPQMSDGHAVGWRH